MVGPLDGIRVVEVASFLAAPSSAALMADMGATVIKIEPPDGDTFRGNRAHLHVSATTNYVFEVDNRGKQSLALDLGKTAAQDALHRLIATADIFITNLTSNRT
jgi:crotonobetainyl-CoA:carnitine CoA-transferase CaiB-like acyl-CoA transferase